MQKEYKIPNLLRLALFWESFLGALILGWCLIEGPAQLKRPPGEFGFLGELVVWACSGVFFFTLFGTFFIKNITFFSKITGALIGVTVLLILALLSVMLFMVSIRNTFSAAIFSFVYLILIAYLNVEIDLHDPSIPQNWQHLQKIVFPPFLPTLKGSLFLLIGFPFAALVTYLRSYFDV